MSVEDLNGRTAIITGSTAGVGRGIATVLAQHGARVAIVARRAEMVEAFAAELCAKHGVNSAIGIAADVSKNEEISRVVKTAMAGFGRVDVLVNNAGRPAHRSFTENDDAEWQEDFELKLMASVRFSRLLFPIMRDAGGGRIINILSAAAKVFPENSTPTSITRAGGLLSLRCCPKSSPPPMFW